MEVRLLNYLKRILLLSAVLVLGLTLKTYGFSENIEWGIANARLSTKDAVTRTFSSAGDYESLSMNIYAASGNVGSTCNVQWYSQDGTYVGRTILRNGSMINRMLANTCKVIIEPQSNTGVYRVTGNFILTKRDATDKVKVRVDDNNILIDALSTGTSHVVTAREQGYWMLMVSSKCYIHFGATPASVNDMFLMEGDIFNRTPYMTAGDIVTFRSETDPCTVTGFIYE